MIRLCNLSYTYPTAEHPALLQASLTVAPGELVLLTGPTGCGKSTLLRVAAGLAGRHGQGRLEGELWLGDASPADLAPSERVRRLGFVAQVPGDQLVAGMVGDELAFAMESAGLPGSGMDARSRALLAQVGLDLDLDRDPKRLSGGQTQRLVVAAALSAGAGALLLDEPLAQLDPAAAQALLHSLRRLADGGTAVLLVEHRVAACLPFVDRVREMAEGRLLPERPPHAVAREAAAQAEAALGRPPPARAPGGARIAVQKLGFRYPGANEDALQDIHLRLHAGERVALVGANGAGKSTLLGCLSGALRPEGLKQPERLLAVPQDPDLALFCESVRAELAYGAAARGGSRAEIAERVQQAAAALDLLPLLDRPPQALSRGQRLRVAVAAALTCDPAVLLLDEPTAGQDLHQVGRIFAGLATALPEALLVFATHDLQLARRWATRVLRIAGGRIVEDGPPEVVLGQGSPGEDRL